jgi:hypothetical protein
LNKNNMLLCRPRFAPMVDWTGSTGMAKDDPHSGVAAVTMLCK